MVILYSCFWKQGKANDCHVVISSSLAIARGYCERLPSSWGDEDSRRATCPWVEFCCLWWPLAGHLLWHSIPTCRDHLASFLNHHTVLRGLSCRYFIQQKWGFSSDLLLLFLFFLIFIFIINFATWYLEVQNTFSQKKIGLYGILNSFPLKKIISQKK